MSSIAWPLFGHEAAEQQFLTAWRSGHFHHGWLLEGPSGIGKSLLAKRIAAIALGAQCLEEDSLDTSAEDPVVQKLMAESHPDLRWVCRRPDEKGKVKQDIPVDDVRALNQFFVLKSGMGGWRVGIIDSLDELNRNGANAMLKTLEEPPNKSLLVLISHGTRPVLPTIRSRCRTLRLASLSEEATLEALKGAGIGDHRDAAKLARGRPGHGLTMSTPTGMAAANAARTYLRALPKPSDAVLSQTIRTGGADQVAFDAFTGEMMHWLASGAEESPQQSKAWLALSQELSRARGLNMDRTQAAAKMLAALQSCLASR